MLQNKFLKHSIIFNKKLGKFNYFQKVQKIIEKLNYICNRTLEN